MTGHAPRFPEPYAETAPRQLYFFLSYARTDDDAHVEQFYHDLCTEVRVRAGLASTEEVGFFDTHSIEIGADWSAELVDAISSCCSFLALCSPRYYVSEPCGREWQIFSDRVRMHEDEHGLRSAALIPVLWLPPRRIPDAVQRLQYNSDAFSEAYRRDGLRQLMRLQRNRDEYIEALSALAERIVDNATTNPLPPVPEQHRSRFTTVTNAFLPPAPNSDSLAVVNSGAARSDHVHFVVAAATRQDAATVRRNVEFYGESPLHWTPYLPSLPKPLSSFAQEIAAKRGLTSEASPIHVPGEQVEAQMSRNRIVVLLIDAWVTQLDQYHRALAEHEARPDAAVTAMVPRSQEDSETSESWRTLSDGLRSVFFRRAESGEPLTYRPDILTHRAFDEDLQVVLEVARNRVFARNVPPAAKGIRPERARPILEGP